MYDVQYVVHDPDHTNSSILTITVCVVVSTTVNGQREVHGRFESALLLQHVYVGDVYIYLM